MSDIQFKVTMSDDVRVGYLLVLEVLPDGQWVAKAMNPSDDLSNATLGQAASDMQAGDVGLWDVVTGKVVKDE